MGPFFVLLETALLWTASALGHTPLRLAFLKNKPDFVSTPLLLPLEVRERTKTINAANGRPRSLVKSLGDFFFLKQYFWV
jgi:hypothetical protein